MQNVFCIYIFFKFCETITWNLKKIWNFKSLHIVGPLPSLIEGGGGVGGGVGSKFLLERGEKPEKDGGGGGGG